MYDKESRCLTLSGLSGGDGAVVDTETFGGKLLEGEYPSPVEKADDDVLAPVDPHQLRQVPLLCQGHHYGKEVRQEQEKG